MASKEDLMEMAKKEDLEKMASKEGLKVLKVIRHGLPHNSYLKEEDKERKRDLSQSHIEKTDKQL